MLWWRFGKRQSGEFCIGCNWIPCYCIRYRNAAITEHGSLNRDGIVLFIAYRSSIPPYDWFQVYRSVCVRGARREKNAYPISNMTIMNTILLEKLLCVLLLLLLLLLFFFFLLYFFFLLFLFCVCMLCKIESSCIKSELTSINTSFDGGGTRLWLGRGCAARTSGP